jgi:hypothetical protein
MEVRTYVPYSKDTVIGLLTNEIESCVPEMSLDTALELYLPGLKQNRF